METLLAGNTVVTPEELVGAASSAATVAVSTPPRPTSNAGTRPSRNTRDDVMGALRSVVDCVTKDRKMMRKQMKQDAKMQSLILKQLTAGSKRGRSPSSSSSSSLKSSSE
eukprot:gnl/Spiro4/1280_TR687_c0_g5_i1.p2 gnl/Spiro4/1280_TR687_c0_g5~~gnl/Spiro4/1280_TR687_c0_g5_i1.p2  ORF type:complete len:110 (+),score=17.76 gnl/Spiro4/1280_TR687_c0_g5_i1:198-527(+)